MAWHNPAIQPLLTDFYQVTMVYAYWKSGKTEDTAVFDLFFRKNPFHGEFTVFAGLSECLNFLKTWKITDEDVTYLKSQLPSTTEEEFFNYLKRIDLSCIELWSVVEGSIVFPKSPLIRVQGPLPVVQLLETTLLTLVNYASLVATNAARFRLAAGWDKSLLEFGLRRAQGPDGGLSASRYCYIGGFDGTSNVLAGKLFGIPIKGTMAHAFVSSFTGKEPSFSGMLQPADKSQEPRQLLGASKAWLKKVAPILGVVEDEVHQGELYSFVAYAIAFPCSFLALVDTYHVLRSGLPCYCAVALALEDFGYKASGLRLDSGDLAYLSVEVRKSLTLVAEQFSKPWLAKSIVVASNDINEDTLLSLKQQGHSIDSFGIGTHLVTCQKQPALGCVFKLVELSDRACMKLSQLEKITIPGKKAVYRLYGAEGSPLLDLLQQDSEPPPAIGQRVLCRHPFDEAKRAYVCPSHVEPLLKMYWKDGKISLPLRSLQEIQNGLKSSLQSMRADHLRPLNPTPYKVSLSEKLYLFMHQLWLEHMPIGELS